MFIYWFDAPQSRIYKKYISSHLIYSPTHRYIFNFGGKEKKIQFRRVRVLCIFTLHGADKIHPGSRI